MMTEKVDSTQLQVLNSPKRTKNISISYKSPPSKGAQNMGHTFYDHPRPAPQCNRPSRNESKVPTFTPKKNFSPRGSTIFGNAAFRLKKKQVFQLPRFLPPHSTLASAQENDVFSPSPTVGLDLDDRIDGSKVQRRSLSPPSWVNSSIFLPCYELKVIVFISKPFYILAIPLQTIKGNTHKIDYKK